MTVATAVIVMRTNHPSRAACVLGRWLGTFALIAAAASCAPNGFNGQDDGSDRSSATDRTARAATQSGETTGAPLPGVATFTAADVARIVLVLEERSVAQAQLAEQRASTMEVKTYAARIVRERTEAMDRLNAILERTTPRSEDATPPLLDRELAKSHEWLVSQDTGFDLAFMTSEIGAHARLLGMLDLSLLPSAGRSSELAEELVALRSNVGAQMVHALRVQGVLRAGGAPVAQTTTASGPTATGDGVR